MNTILDDKVKACTHELKMNHDTLMRANQEMGMAMTQTSANIKNYLATIQGLCNVGIKETGDSLAKGYLEKVNSATKDLASNLSSH